MPRDGARELYRMMYKYSYPQWQFSAMLKHTPPAGHRSTPSRNLNNAAKLDYCLSGSLSSDIKVHVLRPFGGGSFAAISVIKNDGRWALEIAPECSEKRNALSPA